VKCREHVSKTRRLEFDSNLRLGELNVTYVIYFGEKICFVRCF